jgi:hypothetical protein
LYFSISSLTILSNSSCALFTPGGVTLSSSSSSMFPLRIFLIQLPIFQTGENTCNISGLYQAVIVPPNNNISKAIIFILTLSSFSLCCSYLSFHFSISLLLSAFAYSSLQSISTGLL